VLTLRWTTQGTVMNYKLTMRCRDITPRYPDPYGINTVFCYAVDIPRKEIHTGHNFRHLMLYLAQTMGRPYLLGSTRPGRKRRYVVRRDLLGVVRLQFRSPKDRTLVLLKNG
jgi:hypothetical protein